MVKRRDRNELLDARRRYLQTGNIKYAVLAIGKSAQDDIPTWAVDACRDYARMISETPSDHRAKAMSGRTWNLSAHNKAYERLLDVVQVQLATGIADLDELLSSAISLVLKEYKVADENLESWRRALRRRWIDDLEAPDFENPIVGATIDDAEGRAPRNEFQRHRRLTERTVLVGRGIVLWRGQGQK